MAVTYAIKAKTVRDSGRQLLRQIGLPVAPSDQGDSDRCELRGLPPAAGCIEPQQSRIWPLRAEANNTSGEYGIVQIWGGVARP